MTHMHVCINEFGSSLDEVIGLLPIQSQATTSTNADLSWIGLLGTDLNEILFKTEVFSFKEMQLKTVL